MPAKGSSGRTRRPPLRKDAGVALYGPSQQRPLFRVVLQGVAERTVAVAAPWGSEGWDLAEREARLHADALFDQLVAYARQQNPEHNYQSEVRDWDALFARRIQDLKARNKAKRTIAKEIDVYDNMIRPVVKGCRVFDWNRDLTLKVMQAARRVGGERQHDTWSLLRRLYKLAKSAPTWLSPGVDPFERLEAPQRRAPEQGVADVYIPRHLRPSTDQVDALAVAMRERGLALEHSFASRPNKPVVLDRGWGAEFVGTMGKGGLRLGENLGLTVASVLGHDEGERVIKVTHTVEEIDGQWRLKVVKNGKIRRTIVPESVWRPLRSRAEHLLDRFGPDLGPLALLYPAHDHDFREVEVVAHDGSVTILLADADFWDRRGIGRMYHHAVKEADHWSAKAPFPLENLRHHFATWARDLGYSYEFISECLGHHSVAFTMQVYFRPSEKDLQAAIDLSAAC